MSSPFFSCPKCKSQDIEGGHVEIDEGGCWQQIRCGNEKCGFVWNEVYVFAFAETADGCEPIDENGNVVKNITLEPKGK